MATKKALPPPWPMWVLSSPAGPPLTLVVVRVPGHVACVLPLGHDRGDLVVRGAALDLRRRDHRLDREADREHVEPRVPRRAEQVEADHAVGVDMLVPAR